MITIKKHSFILITIFVFQFICGSVLGFQQTTENTNKTFAVSEKLSVYEILELCIKYEAEEKVFEAISLLEKQKRNNSKSIELRELLAKYYIEIEEIPKAVSVYEEIVSINSTNNIYWKQLGKLYTWNDQQKKAIIAYEKALQLNPGDGSAQKELQKLYSWNGRDEDTFLLQRELLKQEPDNIELWQQHGIQARWYNKNDEAIISFKQVLAKDPQNVESLFLLGETYYWMERQNEAEICFKEVLNKKPDHIQAKYYYSQIRQWQPFGWWEANNNYQWILKRQPGHEGSKEQFNLIRKDYGPNWQNKVTYVHDSNDLHKTEITSSYDQYFSSHWQMGGEIVYRHFEEHKPTGHFRSFGQGIRFGNTYYLSQKTNVYASVGYLTFNQQENFVTSEVRWQQKIIAKEKWPGQFISTLALKYDQVMDGVLAVKNKYTSKGFQLINYWEPVKTVKLGSDLQYFWYSDKNEKTQVYITGEYQFYSGRPSFFLETVYAYQDMKNIYPFALPYWTPDDFWTRSLGLDTMFPIRYNLIFRGGFALAQQSGNELANNWKAELNWHPNQFSYLYLHYYDFGSKFYSAQGWLAGFSYRW